MNDDEAVVVYTPRRTVAQQSHETEYELLHDIAQVLISTCCKKICVRQLTVNDIMFSRQKFYAMGVVAQRQWITDKGSTQGTKGELVTKYVVAGKSKLHFAMHTASQ